MLNLSSHTCLLAVAPGYSAYGSVTSTTFVSMHHDRHHLLVLPQSLSWLFPSSFKEPSIPETEF